MVYHRKILEWQARNPTRTWIFWIIVWAIVLFLLLNPRATHGML